MIQRRSDGGPGSPGGAHFGGGADGFGQVGDEDCGQQPDAHAVTGDEADAEHHLLGDPVEERPEGERRPAVAGRRRSGGGPGGLRLAEVFDGTVGQEVGQRPDREAEGDGVAAAELRRLPRRGRS